MSNACSQVIISYSDFSRELRAVRHDARRFATFVQALDRGLDRTPFALELPVVAAAEARADLQRDLRTGARSMRDYLADRKRGGAPDLPSLSDIDRVLSDALREVDRIAQPVGETPQERRRRLGIGGAMAAMSNDVLRTR